MNLNLSEWTVVWLVGFFVVGMLLLFGGGHTLVEGSSRLAKRFGIHPIVIGLTIVALGTSMPEFIVSLIAAIKGETDVALGNIVGSNVSNIGLIMGLAALLQPISVHARLLRFDVPVVILISIGFWIVCANGILSRLDGFLLSTGFVVYMVIVVRRGRREAMEKAKEVKIQVRNRPIVDIALIVAGIIGLALGADMIVDSATEISLRLGAPTLIVGLTIVALGTSLPELATSVVAAIRREGDISAGNIIGSNIFNMMAIAGPSAIFRSLPVARDLVVYHLPAMTVLTILLFPMMRSREQLGRLEGAGLLIFYLAIMTWWVFLAIQK